MLILVWTPPPEKKARVCAAGSELHGPGACRAIVCGLPFVGVSQVWQYILDWLAQGRSPVSVTWRPRVQASFAADAPLPHRAETTALDRAVEWYRAAGLLPGPAYAAALHSAAGACPALAPTAAPPGDGQLGVLEGYTSDVRPGGAQPPSCSLRADCIAETGMAFAVRHAVLGRPADARTATNLLNYMWQHGDYQKPWTPKDAGAPGSTFGLLRWMQHGDPRETIWRDDSARVMLASIAASALLDSPVWQSSLVVAVLAQLRLTGRNGFGPTAGHFTEFQRNGWRSYYDRDWSGHSGVYSPHFQCYIWAVFLWAYHVSSFPPLLDRAERALRAMMDGYPGKWQPTSNGITMQRARMLLPLAWLVRVRDTPQHRQWLLQVISGLLSRQVPCGALQEEIWADGWGKRTRVPNNTDYGTFEAPLNQVSRLPFVDSGHCCTAACCSRRTVCGVRCARCVHCWCTEDHIIIVRPHHREGGRAWSLYTTPPPPLPRGGLKNRGPGGVTGRMWGFAFSLRLAPLCSLLHFQKTLHAQRNGVTHPHQQPPLPLEF